MKVMSINGGYVPQMQRDGDAAYDCYANADITVQGFKTARVPLGFAIELEKGYAGIVTGRSGLTLNGGFMVLLGIIDSNYRGELSAIVYNYTSEPLTINKGVRMSQLIVQQVRTDELHVVSTLSDTERGGDGFGSSGH